MRSAAILFALLSSCVVAPPAFAQTSYPMLMSLKPVAAQVGETSEHTVHARYSMYGAYQVLIGGEGVTGEVVHPEIKPEDEEKPPNLQTMQIRLTVEPDALPGVREFRLATPRGVSTVGQLVIVRDPVIVEEEDNDTAGKAQPVTVPATICGTIGKAEDVDFFRFHVEAETTLSFHVRSMRLQDKIHDLQQHSDPILTLRNAAGVTLAASDNYFRGDPFLGYRFADAGEYLLEIRDVRYQGNQYWEYCIEISDQPFVSNVFPLAAAPGDEIQVELIGFGLPVDPLVTLSVPPDQPPGLQWLALPLGESMTNPAPVIVTDLPLVQESEQDNDSVETAQLVPVPCGINGRIEREGDIDYFAFEAQKGEHLKFEIVARRQQSALDSHLRILDENGKQLALNDDMKIGKRNFADSALDHWTAPADGRYVVEVRDLNLDGGADFVYFLKIERSEPRFRLFADTDKTALTAGTGGAIFVRVERLGGFQGEVQLHVEGLPEGVTATCGRILDDKGQDGCIVLQAGPDAPMAAANVVIRGTASHEVENDSPLSLESVATVYQETYQPGGGRGHWPVGTHTVSVGAAADIRQITLSTTDVVLQPGGSQRIDVTLERAPEFNANVTLDVIFKHLNSVFGNSLPPGVTVDAKNSQTLLTGEKVEGHLTLTAAADAPAVDQQLVPVMASVAINFVMKATYAGPPLKVSVRPPDSN